MGEFPTNNEQPINPDVQPPEGWTPDSAQAQVGENVVPTAEEINGGVPTESSFAAPTPDETNGGEQLQQAGEIVEPSHEPTEQPQPEQTESDQPAETAPETIEAATEPAEPTTELEHSIDHDEQTVAEAAPEPAPERKRGDVYQNEAGKWIRYDGTVTADDGTELANESDVTDAVERKGLERVKDDARRYTRRDRGGHQIQPHDEYFMSSDYADGMTAKRRLTLDEARMQADLLQLDRSEKKTDSDGHEYATGRGPFGYARTGSDGDRFGDNMDRRAKYMELHKEIDPQLAEIKAEQDEIKKRFNAESGSRPGLYFRDERYQELESRKRELEEQVPEGESDYNGRGYQEKVLAEKLDERAEFVNTQVHEIFNLNPDRFATMPTGEFLKVAEDYNIWDKYQRSMHGASEGIEFDISKIEKLIHEGGQATAQDLMDKYYGSETTGYKVSGEDIAAADKFADEIVKGFNDRLPSESYRMLIEYGQKLKAVYESRVAQAQERINKLVAGDDAAEKPAAEES